jgi:cytochrome c oxidase cbb3-type subunit 1
MYDDEPDRARQALVALHATGWLFIANLAGCWISALLLWPSLNDLTAPITYGHWANAHLDLQLYGWCSVPFLGILFHLYLRPASRRSAHIALQCWSAALLFSCIAWLAGEVSGKPFMEWSGPSRAAFPIAMFALFLVLGAGYAQRLREHKETAALVAAKTLLLLMLGAVPVVMYWAAGTELYPPINPETGGATGGSLLGSTLGVVAIIVIFPFAMNLPRRGGALVPATWVLLAAHFAWFELLDHGNHSHHEGLQIASIASLIAWVPVLTFYLRRFTWPGPSRPWLGAFFAWGLLLAVSAFAMFLPGELDRWKFTNVLVAHTHMAMAGMLSCLLVLVMIVLGQGSAWSEAFSRRGSFIAWHGGALLMIGALTWIGMKEAEDPALVYFSAPATQAAYLLRLAAGLLMTGASLAWLAAVTPKHEG